jgi:beta-lactamase superfamily II metal-dependent hydrolase
MIAPPSGVKVRMYRQGHGDCFLLAFPGSNGQTVRVLIDCGYKPGSNEDFGLARIDDIVASIHEATGGRLDLVVITHEHQDHVNALAPLFDKFEVGEAWFAWTEDPKDDLANELRKRHHDQLLGLVAARDALAAAGEGSDGARSAQWLDSLLSLELGVEDAGTFAAAANKDPEKSVNKQGMKLIKDKATTKNTRYVLPHREIMSIPGVDGVRVFAFGPPYDADLINDEDPQGSEAFPGQAMAAYSSFFAAAKAAVGGDKTNIFPFARRFALPFDEAFRNPEYREFFTTHYGNAKTDARRARHAKPKRASALRQDYLHEVEDDAPWRRIDQDWLNSAEELALVLNKGINNTSLVLAFELPKTKKVLLFVGDAQRGNWISWTKGAWKDGDEKITVRDLMSRTVLYKVGHHGSHNATLNGKADSPYPNLSWMGQGKFGGEFTAMITAVRAWAYAVKPKPWRHPLDSIKQALVTKTAGRVFQTDTPTVERQGGSDAEWQDFRSRMTIDPGGLYFDYEVHD